MIRLKGDALMKMVFEKIFALLLRLVNVTQSKPSSTQRRKFYSFEGVFCATVLLLLKPNHLVYKCSDFLKLSVVKRERFVQESQRCHICFAKHATKDHRGSFQCSINNCGQRHNRLLHANTSTSDNTSLQDESRGADETISGETCCYVNQSQRGFRVIVPVEVKARGVAVQTYAFLDTGSETSFIDKDLFSRLHIQENP